MGRLRKRNKPVTTTISISVNLWERIHEKKWRGETNDQFLNKVFSEWVDLTEAYSVLQVTLELAQSKNQEYEQKIFELNSRLHKVESTEETIPHT